MSKRNIVAFAVPLILLLSAFSTIKPVRATGMTLYSGFQNWNFCVGGSSNTGNMNLYSNAGPSGKTWVVIVSIGLNGGDNVQYAYFDFLLEDLTLGQSIVGEYAANQYNWIAQGLVFSSTMTASFNGQMSLYLDIGNPDSNSQCFSVQATTWYY